MQQSTRNVGNDHLGAWERDMVVTVYGGKFVVCAQRGLTHVIRREAHMQPIDMQPIANRGDISHTCATRWHEMFSVGDPMHSTLILTLHVSACLLRFLAVQLRRHERTDSFVHEWRRIVTCSRCTRSVLHCCCSGCIH